MATIARLNVLLGLKSGGFMKELNRAQRRVERAGKQMQGVGAQLTQSITLPLIGIGGAALKMAIDVAETQNKFEVSFGAMSAQAEDWANKLGQSLGLNRAQLKDQAATLNVMTTAMGFAKDEAFKMSTSVVELAGDLSSFHNLPVDEAFAKLRAALVGETEGMRQLGVILDENTLKQTAIDAGLIKVGQTMTEQQKVQARYLAIMNQTTAAQGDLARTADSAANVLRQVQNAGIEMAQKLGAALLPTFENVILPAVQRVMAFADDLIDRFKALPSSTQTAILALAGIAAAAGPVLIALGTLAVSVAAIPAAVAAVGAAFSAVSAPIVIVVGALVAGALLVVKHWEGVRASIMEFASAARSVLGPAFEELRSFAVDTFTRIRWHAITIWPKIEQLIRNVVDTAVGLWDTHGPKIVSKVKLVWMSVKDTIKDAIDIAMVAVGGIVDLLNGDWGKAFDAAKEIVEIALSGIVQRGKAHLKMFQAAWWDTKSKVLQAVASISNTIIAAGDVLKVAFLGNATAVTAIEAGLNAAKNGVAAITAEANGASVAAGVLREEAANLLSPMNSAADAARKVGSALGDGVVAGSNVAKSSAAGVIEIYDAASGRVATSLSGGMGRGFGEGFDKGKKMAESFQQWVEQHPIKWPVELQTPDGMTIQPGGMGLGGGG